MNKGTEGMPDLITIFVFAHYKTYLVQFLKSD